MRRILPAYSLVLGLLALLGFMAIAMGVQQMPEFAAGFKRYGNNFSIPALFLAAFPSWFVGVAFAAIAIGALVPAAIMSIATANMFTRNIYREFIHPLCTDARRAGSRRLVSLVVKAGALVFIFALTLQYALQLQLLGGVWIIQILPPVMHRPLHTLPERLGAAGRLVRRHRTRDLDGVDLGLQGGDLPDHRSVGRRSRATSRFRLWSSISSSRSCSRWSSTPSRRTGTTTPPRPRTTPDPAPSLI